MINEFPGKTGIQDNDAVNYKSVAVILFKQDLYIELHPFLDTHKKGN